MSKSLKPTDAEKAHAFDLWFRSKQVIEEMNCCCDAVADLLVSAVDAAGDLVMEIGTREQREAVFCYRQRDSVMGSLRGYRQRARMRSRARRAAQRRGDFVAMLMVARLIPSGPFATAYARGCE